MTRNIARKTRDMQGCRILEAVLNKAGHILHRPNEVLTVKTVRGSVALAVMIMMRRENVDLAAREASARSFTTELNKDLVITDTRMKAKSNSNTHPIRMLSTAPKREVQIVNSHVALPSGAITFRPSTLSKMLTARLSRTANTSYTLRISSSLLQLVMTRSLSRIRLEQL